MTLLSDGQAPGDSDQPHFYDVYCHLMDKHQATVINTIFYDVYCQLMDKHLATVINPIFYDVYCHMMDKHQATVINPIFIMCTVI